MRPSGKNIGSIGKKDEQAGLYNDLGELSYHLVELHQQGKTTELNNVFAVLGRLVVRGDHYTQEAAIVGLIEDLRYDGLEMYMKPESLKWSNEVLAFWQGQRKNVGEGIEDADKEYLR